MTLESRLQALEDRTGGPEPTHIRVMRGHRLDRTIMVIANRVVRVDYHAA